MLLALVIGLLLPVQVGINVELARRVASPVTAGLISFAVGTAVLIFCGWAMTWTNCFSRTWRGKSFNQTSTIWSVQRR